jgi:hypothetical protein
MKKAYPSFIALLCSIMLLAISTGCDPQRVSNETNPSVALKETVNKQQVSSGEAWLINIFQCKHSNGYCLPDPEEVLTERYLEFYQDQLNIFEYPDFATEGDLIAAEHAYKSKWGDVYPLGKDVWSPFGMGNGMEAGDRLDRVIISHISDFEYSVLIDYGAGSVFSNDVTLMKLGDMFLIDYIETNLIE